MKKKYSEPETRFIRFSVRDIVTTSGDVTGEDPTSENFDDNQQ